MTASAWHYEDNGTDLIGELYAPQGRGNGRAVLVVHEADGIGGNVRRHCAMLASLGYTAAAADMHGGGKVLADEEIPAALDAFREDPAKLRRRARAGLDALCLARAIPPERVVAIGYCFGGWAVLELARSGAPLAAVASFHGLLTTSQPAGPGAISARVLACTGALDPYVPPADVVAFQAEMIAARTDWHLLVHGRALHSYTNADVDRRNDPRMAYDAAAHRQSWSAFLAFLDETFEALPRL